MLVVSAHSKTTGEAAGSEELWTQLFWASDSADVGMSCCTCPVFEPTLEEFSDFEKYIAKIEPIAAPVGICKVGRTRVGGM